MKKLYVVILAALCLSMASAQTQVQTESSELQTELRKLHSTLRALQRTQASQKKTFNILAQRVDSLQSALRVTQTQTAQTADSIAGLSKAQSEQSARIDAIEVSLDTRTALLILALVAVGGLSLVIFFTLKKAIAESSELILQQALKGAADAAVKKQQAVSALIAETEKKHQPITLRIEPELFAPPVEEKPAVPEAHAPIHQAIAEMIEAPEREQEKPAVAERAPQKKTAPRQCQALTQSGTRCKRKASAGSQYCAQHSK
ncbi:MAG: hypothetical protein ACM3Q4_08660 [Acidobacteriota bacterium]